MQVQNIDYRPLISFYRVFLIRLWAKRIAAIVLAPLGLFINLFIIMALLNLFSAVGHLPAGIVAIVGFILLPGIFLFRLGGEIAFAFTTFAFFPFWPILNSIADAFMETYWQRFGAVSSTETVPEYRSDFTALSSFQKKKGHRFTSVVIDVESKKLNMQAEIYREGGVLHLREIKLDLTIIYNFDESIQLPHILVDATPRDQYKLSNLYQRYPDYQVFSAEGEAGTHYRLLTADGNEVGALSILTPDVLWSLLQNLDGADLELKEHEVTFIYRNFHITEENTYKFITGVIEVLPELEKQARIFNKANIMNQTKERPDLLVYNS
jgi:hypothetical protein